MRSILEVPGGSRAALFGITTSPFDAGTPVAVAAFCSLAPLVTPMLFIAFGPQRSSSSRILAASFATYTVAPS